MGERRSTRGQQSERWNGAIACTEQEEDACGSSVCIHPGMSLGWAFPGGNSRHACPVLMLLSLMTPAMLEEASRM